MENRILLRPGSLLAAAQSTTEMALACGALLPIETTSQTSQDRGVNFLIRKLTVARAPKPRQASRMDDPGQRNPFLPYDPKLFVADISDSHVCLLNKFTVIDHHLLIVTRQFEHQEAWLTGKDFTALWACMAEFEGLGFYNGGHAAGASQAHKHLQYVPFPMAPKGPDIPLASLLASDRVGRIETGLALPFVHAFLRFEPDAVQNWRQASQYAFAAYADMLAAAGIEADSVVEGGRQRSPYNLLATREWMLIVPRRCDAVGGISVNGLGFAGHLLARDDQQAAAIDAAGPLNILRDVAVPR